MFISVNTVETPPKVYIYHVKKSDRGDGYKKKMAWLLRDLRILDGRTAEKVTHISNINTE